MKPEKVVLCASSKYEQKFYLNEEFKGLPEEIKKELKIMCVLFTEDVGCLYHISKFRCACDLCDLAFVSG